MMTNILGFPDIRTNAEKAADLEIQQLRAEYANGTEDWMTGYAAELEDRLARVYRELYE